MFDWSQLIQEVFFGELDEKTIRAVSGGDICQSFSASNLSGVQYFLKCHRNGQLLEAEFANLQELARASVRTPKSLGYFCGADVAILLLEYISLVDTGDEYQLGVALADMHAIPAEDNMYGFKSSNFIGHTVQHNTKNQNWAEFWWQQRLRPQLAMAQQAGLATVKASSLRECSFDLLSRHQPKASLLHGDLWSGNKAYTASGEPVLFDPATYYGDRETDIAFTYVFGGFGSDFYRGYSSRWALPADAAQRRPLYNLYHMLNHYNLFGSGYEFAVNSLLRELGVLAVR
ncbi:fructosamine kinase family protein [Gilvimarinus sp. SDUM040013]|uniref:Fructosamine kinase family protein n=1 Tax=Gilvimarinus gilvus TaxID=3058038 RepID=A0ABU4RVI1_9GAMM|nr:fructosamine kinase family protein [Gilvimarinus sp. SDUM040013]MDO3387679.1 fructosamine kinase family protein [Gilvimarinus sp. SDUM040013]MDX6848880.1 fructosamine kinase family protein [Gilvimarinus sp. SDUM040013]